MWTCSPIDLIPIHCLIFHNSMTFVFTSFLPFAQFFPKKNCNILYFSFLKTCTKYAVFLFFIVVNNSLSDLLTRVLVWASTLSKVSVLRYSCKLSILDYKWSVVVRNLVLFVLIFISYSSLMSLVGYTFFEVLQHW